MQLISAPRLLRALALAAVPVVGLAFAACSSSSSSGTPSPTPDAGGDAEDAAPVDASDDVADATAEDAGHACALAYLGDPSQPIVLELVARDVTGVSAPVAEGAMVPLVTPPQGGKVAFIGVRATNLSPCSVVLSGALRDPISKQVRVDQRSLNLTPTGDGWGVSADSNIATFANVPVCPNQWAMQDAYGQTFELDVTLTDADGRTVEKKLGVTPFCAETDPAAAKECACSCKQGYVLGQVCN